MFKFRISSTNFIFLYSLITLVLYNLSFWDKTLQHFAITTFKDSLFIIQFLIILLTLHVLIYTCILFKYSTKIFSIVLLHINAVAAYFINAYGIAIDSNMLQNVFKTDWKEASDLLSFYFAGYILLLGILPSSIIFKSSIIYKSFWKECLHRMILCIILAVFCLILIAFNYKELSIFIRLHKNDMGYLVPRNYIYSLLKLSKTYIKQDLESYTIGEDATMATQQNKLLVVLIVGEAARKQNFSLFGYHRETNPYLKKHHLITLGNTTSCGTSTEISLPCIFSHLDRDNFIKNTKHYEFLPSLLSRKNVDVTWLENNFGGCKKTCNNVKTINTQKLNIKNFCDTGECFDGILVEEFKDTIKNKPLTQNKFIVLHQNGSHGPKYSKRYPKEFEKFKPVCNNTNLSKCSKEELINAYDNTILYTDYIIHKVISELESMHLPSVVIYISDHGESLGEYNIYLHGFPYNLAPKEQKEIPFIIWISPQAKKEFKKLNHINKKSAYSHDNIFHSILGLFGINTSLYNKDYDIFYTL